MCSTASVTLCLLLEDQAAPSWAACTEARTVKHFPLLEDVNSLQRQRSAERPQKLEMCFNGFGIDPKMGILPLTLGKANRQLVSEGEAPEHPELGTPGLRDTEPRRVGTIPTPLWGLHP